MPLNSSVGAKQTVKYRSPYFKAAFGMEMEFLIPIYYCFP